MKNWIAQLRTLLIRRKRQIACQYDPEGICRQEERRAAEARDREHRANSQYLKDRAELLARRGHRGET